MSKAINFISSLVLLVFFAFFAPPTLAADKLQFKKMSSDLRFSELITELFKLQGQQLSVEQKQKYEKLRQANQENWLKWRQAFQQSVNFVRGEIEDETTLNNIILWFQYSALRPSGVNDKSAQELTENMSAWMRVSADLAYEESSLIGLRAASVLRNLAFDQLDQLLEASTDFAPSINQVMRGARAPWPIDRVLMAEGKKVLAPPALLVLEKAAFDLQKNPYQSLEKALKKRPGAELTVLAHFKSMWTDQDIERMTEEVNRLGQLQLKSAAKVFQLKQKRPAKSIEELLSQQLLDRAPIDYKTGKKMELSSQL